MMMFCTTVASETDVAFRKRGETRQGGHGDRAGAADGRQRRGADAGRDGARHAHGPPHRRTDARRRADAVPPGRGGFRSAVQALADSWRPVGVRAGADGHRDAGADQGGVRPARGGRTRACGGAGGPGAQAEGGDAVHHPEPDGAGSGGPGAGRDHRRSSRPAPLGGRGHADGHSRSGLGAAAAGLHLFPTGGRAASAQRGALRRHVRPGQLSGRRRPRDRPHTDLPS